ncbi:MAG: GNAT family N-acetyltransferase [Anaerolineales bacterium]|nr:GNAT family N-acetyltransferase [Anaerolineales bacterium]
MYWKRPRKDFTAGTKGENRLLQKDFVASGRIPGLLAVREGVPLGWIAVEPRDQYPGLARSRILKPVDGAPVWSVTCFFVAREHRGQGLTVALLQAAIDYVRRRGGKMVEGYPVEPREGRLAAPVFVYTGLVSAFRQAGFEEVARRSETRPIMRYRIP